MFFVHSTNFNPSFVITLFSSTKGTISEIVPIDTISKYFKYSFYSKSNLMLKACVTLNATPTPANSLNSYLLSFLLQSTTAIASGKTSGGSWWSVTIVSIPSDFAKSICSFPCYSTVNCNH